MDGTSLGEGGSWSVMKISRVRWRRGREASGGLRLNWRILKGASVGRMTNHVSWEVCHVLVATIESHRAKADYVSQNRSSSYFHSPLFFRVQIFRVQNDSGQYNPICKYTIQAGNEIWLGCPRTLTRYSDRTCKWNDVTCLCI